MIANGPPTTPTISLVQWSKLLGVTREWCAQLAKNPECFVLAWPPRSAYNPKARWLVDKETAEQYVAQRETSPAPDQSFSKISSLGGRVEPGSDNTLELAAAYETLAEISESLATMAKAQAKQNEAIGALLRNRATSLYNQAFDRS